MKNETEKTKTAPNTQVTDVKGNAAKSESSEKDERFEKMVEAALDGKPHYK